LKRKFLLSMLAAIPAVLLPLSAACQVAPAAEPSYKYSAFAGFGYTSLNQVNHSRYGLMGVQLGVTRELGKYVGLLAEGSDYQFDNHATTASNSAANNSNPGDPSVDTVLFGPVFHGPLYGPVDGFVDILIGGEHTGGEKMTPKVSFAGGFGGGLTYKLNKRFSLRASGERIESSFSVTNNSAALGDSAHKHWNARGGIGVVYRF